MPLLRNGNTGLPPGIFGKGGSIPPPAQSPRPQAPRSSSFFPVCGNRDCSTSWLRLWRSRQTPIFEGRWACSPACTQAFMARAVSREMAGAGDPVPTHAHRVPLGLMLLSQGLITHAQLRQALESQREAGAGRIGTWLVRHHAASESQVTRALSLQWSCPVFTLEQYRPDTLGSVVPRLLLDTFGVLPLRIVDSRVLYIAFEDRIDHCVSLGLERMTGLRVESGLMASSEFTRAHTRLLAGTFPKSRLLGSTDVDGLSGSLAGIVEASTPTESRLVRIHDLLWLRCWSRDFRPLRPASLPARDSFEDTLCALHD